MLKVFEEVWKFEEFWKWILRYILFCGCKSGALGLLLLFEVIVKREAKVLSRRSELLGICPVPGKVNM
jgi:hypothetical protein